MKTFVTENFLLNNETARRLYHNHAANMGIYDYHCHIPPSQIAQDINFQNMTQIWLYGDHYKWRAMRTNGVDEKYCTGDATDWEKFEKWAQTVPHCLRNPLYHWTHLELLKPFGIDEILNPESAAKIYEACSEMLETKDFSCRNLIRKANVKVICTTDDPTDDLKDHQKIRDDGFEVKVRPTFRPDKSMAVENVKDFNSWVDKLAQASDTEINNFETFIEAIAKRHKFFHENGCRISDHGLETAYAEDYTMAEIRQMFDSIRSGQQLSKDEQLKFKSAMLIELGVMDHNAGWVQQYHLGALRNNNTRLFNQLGPDTGFDSIGDFETAKPLSKMLDRLDSQDKLAKTILYNLNPRDNEVMATMIGNFQDGSIPGKMQYGSGWWFLDQKDGMEKQLNALSNLGLLSRFVGMLTDSRSFLSYSRHEYFRRILCNMIGCEVENGQLPKDMKLLGEMVENICYNNAANYFGI